MIIAVNVLVHQMTGFVDAETGVEEMSLTRTLPVAEAVGTVLAHDITEIIPGQFKGRAFKKGHIIREEDVKHLQQLGKERLFVLELGHAELHEDDAAPLLASALAGKGVRFSGEPVEGKLELKAAVDGLLKVDIDALYRFNLLGEVMCSSRHTNSLVKQGETVAGTRAIPLIIQKRIVEEAMTICQDAGEVLQVLPLRKARVGVVITGNEVYYGRIEDRFRPVIQKKVDEIGSSVMEVHYVPDDRKSIAGRIIDLMDKGADLIIATGGMSVDPDDMTRLAVSDAGAREMTYGSAVLPGAMFMLAYIEEIPVIGVPACGMFHGTTLFDLILPRILAGERLTREDFAALGHGGLCLNCGECRFPICPFGK